MFTISSGADVPNATTVRPITNEDIPSRLARADAPSTNQLPPIYRKTIPRIISR
jgi:hypothetical protein